MNNDFVLRGGDREPSIANWADTNERLLEPRHDVSCLRECVRWVGDLVLGSRDRLLALTGGRTNSHGGRRGVDLGHRCIF